MAGRHFFTYRIKTSSGGTLKIGKGSVDAKDRDSISTYLAGRYGGGHPFEYTWHSSESAAFKAETDQLEAFRRARGDYPPWNDKGGGGGGRVEPRCKATLQDGSSCQNAALPGNYGFCGLHR